MAKVSDSLGSQLQAGPHGVGIVWAIAWGFGALSPAQAQLIPDLTLPTPSSTSVTGNITTISGGTEAGANLFHSFGQFSVGAGTTARFQTASFIDRIFTRVTGNSPSIIDGSLAVSGSDADLFLLNPQGILFGPNASLDLNGSLIATTAEQLLFPDGSFGTVNPSPSALLSITAPLGLQFGGTQAPIQVNGSGNGLSGNANGEIIKTNRPLGLQVQPQRTLALLGGSVVLDGGNVTAGDAATGAGRVAIAAAGSGAEVQLDADALGWQVSVGGGVNLSDVTLQNAASVDTSSLGGGPITVYGETIRLSDGSTLLSQTLGGGNGAAITLEADQTITLEGIAQDAATGQPLWASSLVTEVGAGANGPGGAVNITAESLALQDGAQISTKTYGAGDSGDLNIQVQKLDLIGASALGPSLLDSFVGSSGTGSGGDIQVTADEVTGRGHGSIATSALGAGQGGQVLIKAADVNFEGGSPAGPSGVFSEADLGQGGGLEIESDRLSAAGGAQISANTSGQGNGGDIIISAQELSLEGTSPQGASTGIQTAVEQVNTTGNGGDISLQVENLTVRDGAQVAVNTSGAGNGGTLTLSATDISLEGAVQTAQGSKHSGLFATVDSAATGAGGVINVDAAKLNMQDGARIVTATEGIGDAGALTINADEVTLFDTHELGPTGLLTSAILGPGAGGVIEVNANLFQASDGAVVSASNFLLGTETQAGQGLAGIVIINAEQIALSDDATITTASAGGVEGDVLIETRSLNLRRGASIQTNAFGPGTGGNISINADSITAVPGENSDIVANAANNLGGQVEIRTDSLLGLQLRDTLTSQSDIIANSVLGLAIADSLGLNGVEVPTGQGIDPLSTELSNPAEQAISLCPGDPKISAGGAFQFSRRAARVDSSLQVADNLHTEQDDRSLTTKAKPLTKPVSAGTSGSAKARKMLPLQEAQHFIRDRQGRIRLLAGNFDIPTPTPSFSCQS